LGGKRGNEALDGVSSEGTGRIVSVIERQKKRWIDEPF